MSKLAVALTGGVSGAGGILLRVQNAVVLEVVLVETGLLLDWNVVGLVLESPAVLGCVEVGCEVWVGPSSSLVAVASLD